MRLTFDNAELESLFNDDRTLTKFSPAIVRAFRVLITRIVDAANENELRGYKGLHFEKLKGRTAKYSMRLNKQFRLLFTIEAREDGNVLHIKSIEDYH